MTRLVVEIPFSATHQIEILGALEPVHGHDFRCVAEIDVADERDASLLLPALRTVLARLERTHLDAVAAGEGGLPSAERIARFVFRALAAEVASDAAARVAAVTIHEAPGCSATWRVA